jgi:hypothetical protein
VREIVIVITDLYLAADAPGARATLSSSATPGIARVGRFARRERLADGWRAWLAHRLGRPDLARAAAARVAAAALDAGGDDAAPGNARGSLWIATPVHLVAGLTRVHLGIHGILRLAPRELSALAAEFARAFGGAGHVVYPLPCGQLLLFTAGMPPCVSAEPARAAAGELAELLPQGAQARTLRRLGAEIEMWLHAQPLNAARERSGQAPVTALWLWGAAGDLPGAASPTGHPLRAYGCEPWLDGLLRLTRGTGAEVAPGLVADGEAGGLEVWAVALAALTSRPGAADAGLSAALEELDARYVSPALAALRRGTAGRVSLVANDVCLTLRRSSALQRWRGAAPGASALLAKGAS